MSKSEINPMINTRNYIKNIVRDSIITENAEELKPKESKVVLVGDPDCGKSAIIKCFFYGMDSKEIINTNIEPTYSIEVNVFEKNEEKIAIFEIPGALTSRYLSGEDAEMVFEEADGILLILNTQNRDEKKWERKLKRIYYLKNRYCPSASVVTFLHKAEFILNRPRKKRELESLIKRFNQKFSSRFFITSIYPEFYKRFEYSMKLALLEMPKPKNNSGTSNSDLLLQTLYKKVSILDENINVDEIMKRQTIKIYEYLV